MKALSIHPLYAMAIISGIKSIEVRTWKTAYRGDLLICSTAKKCEGTIPGHALGVVTLKDCRPMKKSDCDAALMDKKDYHKGDYAWVLENNRLIVPVPVKGKLSLWNYDGEIQYIPEEEWILKDGEEDTDEVPEWEKKYWEPLIV